MTEMKLLIKGLLLILATFIFSFGINGQIVGENESERQAAWQKIGPFFSPPDEFKDKYGDYRSPLKFYNGQPVWTPNDWKKRRDEILVHWNDMMGFKNRVAMTNRAEHSPNAESNEQIYLFSDYFLK